MPQKLTARALTEPEILRMAEVTDADKAAMVAAWKRDAKGPAQKLIDAVAVTPE